MNQKIITDWSAVSRPSAISLRIAGRGRRGKLIICLRFEPTAGGFRVRRRTPEGSARPIEIAQEMFEHSDDASPTKYGGTGIEIALAFKFAQLLGGEIRSVTNAAGRPATILTIPDLYQTRRELAA